MLHLKGSVREGFIRHPQNLVLVTEQAMIGQPCESFFVKRGTSQEELKLRLEKFAVKLEPYLTFCDVYPTTWFQTDIMVGNVVPFHGNLVAVIKLRNNAGWNGLFGYSPQPKTFAVVLLVRRGILVADLLAINDSDSMEELFWPLSEQYSLDDNFFSLNPYGNVGAVSDRVKLEFDWDVSHRRGIYLDLTLKKQIIQPSPDEDKEKMYVLSLRLGDRGSTAP